MKAIYVKPSLKSIKIDAEESMLAGSGEYNLAPTGENYTGDISNTESTQVGGGSALSKQGSFLGNQWEDKE